VHCTTETIAAEFDELFGPGLRSAGRLVVIPFGIPELGPPGRLAPRVVRQIGGSPYVLALGTLTPRKNLPRLVVAFGVIAGRHPTLRLVLAGPDGLDRPAVQAAISSLDPTVAQRVVITGEVDEQTRRALIEGAAVMAYPSAYEGFGFPILEAMTLRVPVLAADAGALREVADGSAHLVDPLDVQSIAAGLDLLMTDASLREELIERGTRRATAFSWRRTARELRAVYEELAGRSARISL
jgi:glycosyltransferase involved in cell wall biosynthesis